MECPLWMFIKASDVRRFVVIDERSQMFNLRIVENVTLISADVTGSVYMLFLKVCTNLDIFACRIP